MGEVLQFHGERVAKCTGRLLNTWCMGQPIDHVCQLAYVGLPIGLQNLLRYGSEHTPSVKTVFLAMNLYLTRETYSILVGPQSALGGMITVITAS